ncbi:MAG: hypothetical protein HKN04_05210 [Rhodothermaceae bacterium]|nr:hypothetical protein [Rhodothermaceae bacterium]
MRAQFRSVLVLPLLLAPLLFAGCDEAGGGNTFTFGVSGVRFDFSFTGNQVMSSAAAITSPDMGNVLTDIQSRGFGAADVLAVRLVPGEAQIRIVQAPGGTEIDFLDNVTLRLGSAASNTVVASQNDFASMTGTMAGEAELDVNATNIAAIATGGDFSAFLDVLASGANAGSTYDVEVIFDVEVEVEAAL